MLDPVVIGIAVAVVVAAVVGVVLIKMFNTLVDLRNRYLNAFAQIQVQLKRRHDLIPNLVEATKAYLDHESETLEKVIAARNSAANKLGAATASPSTTALAEVGVAEGLLTGAMRQFSMVVEAYPDLKANENIRFLTEELTSTENKIGFSRQLYNDLVTIYNTFRQSFPAVVFASSLGHSDDAVMLEFEDHAAIQQAPQVALSSEIPEPAMS